MAKFKQQGITILEMMLVLAIIAMISIMGIRLYLSFRADVNLQQMKYTVDTIFQAMNMYYRANCYGTSTTKKQPGDKMVTYGTLNLNNPDKPSNPYPINIDTDLRNTGYLRETLPYNPIIDNNAASPYILQFNKGENTTRYATVCKEFDSSKDGCKEEENEKIATIINWTAQVAIKLDPKVASDPAKVLAYAKITGATCIANEGQLNDPCMPGVLGVGDYLVFQRIPSYPSSNTMSDFYTFNASVSNFTQMYTTYPSHYLVTSGGDTDEGKQYVYCGN